MTILELISLRNIKALLAVFFNLVDDDSSYFYVESRYKKSKFAPNELDDSNYPTLNEDLRAYFGLNFENNFSGNHSIKIEKTAEFNTADKFLAEIYKQIQLLSFEIETKEYEKNILLALFALRGSADFSLKYYAVDIHRKYSSKDYLRNIFQYLQTIRDLFFLIVEPVLKSPVM